MVWLIRLMLLLSSCVNLSWAEIQEIEAYIFKDQNQKLECRVFAPDLIVNETFRVYVNTPDDVKLYSGSCFKTINGIDSVPLWIMKDTERARRGYVTTNAAWHLPGWHGIKCKFYTNPCDAQNKDYCFNRIFGVLVPVYDIGLVCQSEVKIRAQINNTKEIKVNILKDQQDGMLKCEEKTTDLLVNETFQIYVNTPEDEDLALFGGRCFDTRKDDQDTDLPKIDKYFWKKSRDSKHGYVSNMVVPLTRLGIHDCTCEVFTKPCDSLYDNFCKYDVILYDKGLKCNMKINIVNPEDIEEGNDYFVIIVAFASITALVIVIAAVWTIIYLSRRKRKAPHVSNSSDIDYQIQPRNNEVSKPIPAQRYRQKNLYANTSGNTEAPYAAAVPKHLRKPKSDRYSKTIEPNYVTVHTQSNFNRGEELNEELEENEYANLSVENLTYAVLYRDESKDGGVNLRSQSPYVQIRHIDEQNYVNVEQLKTGVEDVYEQTNSTYVNVKNKR